MQRCTHSWHARSAGPEADTDRCPKITTLGSTTGLVRQTNDASFPPRQQARKIAHVAPAARAAVELAAHEPSTCPDSARALYAAAQYRITLLKEGARLRLPRRLHYGVQDVHERKPAEYQRALVGPRSRGGEDPVGDDCAAAGDDEGTHWLSLVGIRPANPKCRFSTIPCSGGGARRPSGVVSLAAMLSERCLRCRSGRGDGWQPTDARRASGSFVCGRHGFRLRVPSGGGHNAGIPPFARDE